MRRPGGKTLVLLRSNRVGQPKQLALAQQSETSGASMVRAVCMGVCF
jgi:hypothetical protein